jgi:hypothetical protein
MSDENQILLEKLKKYLSVSVCQERYEHSMRTAQTAKELCLRFGEDSELGEIAGVAHDICKEMKKNLLFLLVEQDGMEISQIEKDKPSLLHGRAASVVLKNVLGPGFISGFNYVQINGVTFEPKDVKFITNGQEILGTEVSEANPIAFRLGQSGTLVMSGQTSVVVEGSNKIVIEAMNPEAGKVVLSVEDVA